MKLVSFLDQRKGGARRSYGALIDNRIVDLATAAAPTLRDALTIDGVAGIAARLQGLQGAGGPTLREVTLLTPIPDPDKIMCVGLNYHAHAAEANLAVPSKPSVFVRFASSLASQGEPVLRPIVSEQFDYEAELAVVIGRRARRIAEADALQYVAGYACLAENSVRDWQRHSAQATAGKNFVKSGAFGPWLVTPDEAPSPEQMSIIGRLNGEIVQNGSCADLIFGVAQIIAYVTTFTELLPGDVIATGTPAGVGMSRKPPRFLRNGDVFEVEISGLGTLRNPVRDDL
ncbi:fumarylacetoacetate hydrolase family protein [Paraburkholderia sp. ZP32-5]|uniref:fumarylacetoacetate hydrolase family protein n=1 Tax=Paraburkholderia sp. ZP32-5 TaxID=2883245 RepID=UPI001F3044C6|nr:fumarylacetoacetate hydrolase family protein [Paraburkholderia sp. ZP32-5]